MVSLNKTTTYSIYNNTNGENISFTTHESKEVESFDMSEGGESVTEFLAKEIDLLFEED